MYKVKLLKLDNMIEEEVTIEINGKEVVGFSSICPYKIIPGEVYSVNLRITLLDMPEIIKRVDEKFGLERVGKTYEYILYGKIDGDSLDIGNGIKIQDEIFIKNSYLNGEHVQIKVDRLSVEFV